MHACVTYGGVESWYVREGKTAFNDRMSFSIYAGSLARILCGPVALPLRLFRPQFGGTAQPGRLLARSRFQTRTAFSAFHSNLTIVQTLQKLLMRRGHKVIVDNTVAAALCDADAGPFDLVYYDFGLPDSSGV